MVTMKGSRVVLQDWTIFLVIKSTSRSPQSHTSWGNVLMSPAMKWESDDYETAGCHAQKLIVNSFVINIVSMGLLRLTRVT